jgi:hypothetical protein
MSQEPEKSVKYMESHTTESGKSEPSYAEKIK